MERGPGLRAVAGMFAVGGSDSDSVCPLRPAASRLWVPASASGFATLGARFGLRLRDSVCPLRPAASRLWVLVAASGLAMVCARIGLYIRDCVCPHTTILGSGRQYIYGLFEPSAVLTVRCILNLLMV